MVNADASTGLGRPDGTGDVFQVMFLILLFTLLISVPKGLKLSLF